MPVRRAGAGEAQVLAEVHVAAWREAYEGLLPEAMIRAQSVPARRAAWDRELADPATFVLLATDGPLIQGFAAGGAQRDPILLEMGYDAEITAIYLRARSKRQGVGRQLMAASATELMARNHSGLALWVLDNNTGARGFYEMLGGQPLHTRDERRGAHVLTQIAYGWQRLADLT